MFQLNTKLGAVKYELAYTVAYMLLYTNAATNFIIYCAFGNTFRRELFKMLVPKCGHKQLGPSRSGCSGFSDVSKAEKSVKYLFSYTHSPGPKHSFTVTSEVDPTDFNDLESGS
ncbi:type-1 angiotensin II receptor B [Biomphalaria pfeifferi]|uniref:Type-1 angiotensin II receptor B n=1 Tax=Biomphalaria pfeifferi TaxID=112525 RepID=A0AAD8ATN3_BIOPF|nr:type-1 angiotensin II receptor B [Biomphalaria pfeifferi]